VAVGAFDELPKDIAREKVLDASFRCLFDPQVIKLGKVLTLNCYLDLEHILVSFSGDFQSLLEEKFALTSQRRNIVANTSRSAALPYLIKGGSMVATVPEYLAHRFAKNYGLAKISVPFFTEYFALETAWPLFLDSVPDHQWLRSRLKKSLCMKEMIR
jgi:LysR family transcriptional regulator, mexEF-oprN operon transcriptional activator